MEKELRILMLEDQITDADLIERELRKGGLSFTVKRVETEDDFVRELDNFLPDIILADYRLPAFNGLSALALTRQKYARLPFIMITGTLGDELAVETFKKGATDYVLKDRLARLVPAVNKALHESDEYDKRKRLEEELRASHERLSQLIQHSPAVIYSLEIDGQTLKPLFVSDNIQRMLGFSAAETCRYEWWLESLHPEDRDRVLAIVSEGMKGQGYEMEYRLRDREGAYHWVRDRNRVICDLNGRPFHAVGVWTDITPRKNLEAEREQLKAQLFQAQKMEAIGQLAGGIAHDFNNILSVIGGYGQIALMNMPNDDLQRMNIKKMIESVDRAAHLTKDLLLFSRKQVGEHKPANLNDIIRKVEKLLVRIIGEDIECKTVLHDDPVFVYADSNQLQQVLMNLAANARDAMSHGGVFTIISKEVSLGTNSFPGAGVDKPGRYAQITVSDTGKGMDKETQQHIFEPFFTTKDVGKGTGLGLAVVYGIISQHAGHIEVDSVTGKGTTFQLYLPVITQTQMPGEETEVPQPETPARGTETILIAEDDNPVRELTRIALTQFGFTVIEAVDGEEAVRKFMENKDKIDLLLFDIIMPKMTGKEAYDEILKIRPDMKVLFVSGYAPDNLRFRVSLEDGASLIYKPVSPNELLNRIRKLLDKKPEMS